MKKEQVVNFAQNYHLNSIKNPSQNKLWGIVWIVIFPLLISLFLKFTLLWVTSLLFLVVTLLLSIFANKIGNIEVVNNVAIFMALGIYMPVLLFFSVHNLFDYKLLVTEVALVSLAISVVVGIFYTMNKMKTFQIKKKKPMDDKKAGIIAAILMFVFTFIIRGMDKTSIGYFIVILASVLMIACVPFFVASVTQLIVLKRYKLEIKAQDDSLS